MRGLHLTTERRFLDGRTACGVRLSGFLRKRHYPFGQRTASCGLTGYDGTFLIDPATTDLVQLVGGRTSFPSEKPELATPLRRSY